MITDVEFDENQIDFPDHDGSPLLKISEIS